MTDAGVGAADLDAGPDHLGVPTMHARGGSAGGHLQIEGVPGAGATVTLTLPGQERRRGVTGSAGPRQPVATDDGQVARLLAGAQPDQTWNAMMAAPTTTS